MNRIEKRMEELQNKNEKAFRDLSNPAFIFPKN